MKEASQQTEQAFDRSSEATAQSIIEQILPDADVREQCLQIFVDSINYVNSLKPSVWSLNLRENLSGISLVVGFNRVLNVGRFGKDILYILVDGTALNAEQRAELEGLAR